MREATPDDRDALAELMLDAYRGTIDYDGETLEQAVDEVDGHFAGAPDDDASLLVMGDGRVQAAVLVAHVRGAPLIGYLMTRAATKNRGVASALLDAAAARVWRAGAGELRAWITSGNLPSEAIFRRAGFEIVDSVGEA